MYVEDRRRFQALPLVPDQHFERISNAKHSPPMLKPKAVLLDKLPSEPTSHITKTLNDPVSISLTRRPMHRGFSDLGKRIKKRVTLRSAFFSVFYYWVVTSVVHISSPYDGEVVIVVPALDQSAASSSRDHCISSSAGPSVATLEHFDADLGRSRIITESSGTILTHKRLLCHEQDIYYFAASYDSYSSSTSL